MTVDLKRGSQASSVLRDVVIVRFLWLLGSISGVRLVLHCVKWHGAAYSHGPRRKAMSCVVFDHELTVLLHRGLRGIDPCTWGSNGMIHVHRGPPSINPANWSWKPSRRQFLSLFWKTNNAIRRQTCERSQKIPHPRIWQISNSILPMFLRAAGFAKLDSIPLCNTS